MVRDEDLVKWLDHKRKQHRVANPPDEKATPLADPIKKSIKGLERRHRFGDLDDAWQQAVGGDTARHCQIVGLKNGVIYVIVDSAACRQELSSFRKKEILAGLQKRKGMDKVYDIEFRLGTLEQL
jgi:predicted nucleic acid-binding Zn ribbon protein